MGCSVNLNFNSPVDAVGLVKIEIKTPDLGSHPITF
ncbi:MAG: hypothetical protein ACI8YQ_005078 [Polaribacter sp.]|jgi:hypothetical protein